MEFKEGDRVVFTGKPGSDVTEWLLRNRAPGTVIRHIWEEGDGLVMVLWDGLRDMIRKDGTKKGSGIWAVYEEKLALLDN